MYFVYLIISKNKDKFISYVGYTKNIKTRLFLHNTGKGAKFTKGRFWKLVYYKKYKKKSVALKEEYKLKKNFKLREEIKKKNIKDENFCTSSI